jgi:putative transposase
MGLRKITLATGEIYHIYNRCSKGDIFTHKQEVKTFLAAVWYYLQITPPVKFSIYKKQPDNYRLSLKKTLVDIYAYCLMPNHFHFILKQNTDKGIQFFMQRLSGSYSHYYNLRNNKRGMLFDSFFKAKRIENQEQLTHLSRYIHLNPVTSFLVEDPIYYEYSSYQNYLGLKNNQYLSSLPVMANFTPDSYKLFVLDRKDYQRELATIKHLSFE